MSSTYELCPAIQHDGGYLIVRRVEKAFPVFLRCTAAQVPSTGSATAAALEAATLCASLDAFSVAVARLVNQPVLRAFDGGEPVLVYVARPGKEDLFEEFAGGLDQADDLPLSLTLPEEGHPLVLVFGGVSAIAPTSVASADTPSSAPDATLVHVPPRPPAIPTPEPQPEAVFGDETVVRNAASAAPESDGGLIVAAPADPELQPLPVIAHDPAPDADLLPPVEVVVSTTSALDSLLKPTPPEPPEPAPSQPKAEPAAIGATPSEPALEILLRQAPRLHPPERELGPVEQTLPDEASRGLAPEEVLAAVRQVVGALDDALRRQSDEHERALQAVVVATQQAIQQQSLALEARQAELWDQQQAALRQMHADQAAAIQTALTRLDEERSAWQSQALRELRSAGAQQLPGALRQLQDDLASRQQQTLTQLRDDLLSRQPAAPAGPLASPGAMQELNWQLEKSAVSSQDLRQRVGQLLWVNVLLMLGIIGLAVAVFWLVRGGLAQSVAPTATVAPTASPVPPTPVPPTPLPPTAVPATATAAATPTTAATALPVFLAALRCANTERPRNFYDCTLTNSGAVTDTLALAVQVAGNELNGFRPLVVNDELERVPADPVTGLFSLGRVGPGETLNVRVMLPCAVITGCAETTFSITPLVDSGRTLIANEVVEVTTHYFPPEPTTAP